MSYTTIVFLVFVAVSGLLYYVLPKKCQWCVLLVASMFFYFFSGGVKTIFILATTAIIYGAGLLINKQNENFKVKKKELDKAQRKLLKNKVNKHKKAIVTFAVVIAVAFLALTKYLNFLGSIVNGISSIFHQGALVPVFEIVMPLGISYYTLMSISYIVDVYRGVTVAEKNPFKLLLFLSYFPHIVEGPFDRYNDLAPQFVKPHYINVQQIKCGGVRLVWGLIKKFVIADRAGLIVNTVFDTPDKYKGVSMFFLVILYTFQIYAEFSGCMDMVCGVSEMFDVRIAENFKRPFFANSIADFWRRWHITLGLWLKDYIFYPVSLSKGFKNLNTKVRKKVKSEHLVAFLPAAYALFFVWFTNGLWHGASIKYIVYGLYYYILMMIGQVFKPVADKVLKSIHIDRQSKSFRCFEIFRTFIIVCFGMLIFRSESLSQAGSIFANMFANPNWKYLFNGTLLVKGVTTADYVVLALSVILIFVVSLLQEKGHDLRTDIGVKPLPIRWSIYIIMLLSIVIFGVYGGGVNTQFIYGQF